MRMGVCLMIWLAVLTAVVTAEDSNTLSEYSLEELKTRSLSPWSETVSYKDLLHRERVLNKPRRSSMDPHTQSGLDRLDMVLHSMKGTNTMVLTHGEVQKLQQSLGWTIEQLLTGLIHVAADYSNPTISKYQVGAVALGESGAVYLGANQEFSGAEISTAVHAEECAIANAALHGEQSFTKLAIAAAPCGFCRQLLNEVSRAQHLQIWFGDALKESPAEHWHSLRELLPNDFGPQHLDNKQPLLSHPPREFVTPVSPTDPLTAAALAMARRSYSPYTHSPAAVALQTADGRIFAGMYLEGVAFNPSMLPLQCALVDMLAKGVDYHSAHVVDAVLVQGRLPGQPGVDHRRTAREVMAALGYPAKLRTVVLPVRNTNGEV